MQGVRPQVTTTSGQGGVIPDAAHLLNIEQDVAFDASLLGFLDRLKT